MPELASAPVSTPASAGFNLGSEIDSAFAEASIDTAMPGQSEEPAPSTESAPTATETTTETPSETVETEQAESSEVIPPVAEEPAEPTIETAPDEDVEIRTKPSGKKEFVLREAQFTKFRDGFHAARQAEEVLGEPLSAELIQDLQNVRADADSMRTDFLSGDPQRLAGRFFDYFNKISQQAVQAGEVAHDPFMSMAAQMPQYLAQRHPQAYTAQARVYVKDTLDALFGEAVHNRNKDLEASVQWIYQSIFGKYPKPDQVSQPDPLAERQALLDQRQREFDARVQRESTERWNNWNTVKTQNIRTAMSEEISTALKPIEAAYKQFPEAFQSYKDRLNSIVQESIAKDENFRQQRDNLQEQARITPSEQRRVEIAEQIANRYRTKVRQVLNPANNKTVRDILNQGAAAVKARADAETARLKTGAERREPGGGGAPAQRSVLPTRAPNGRFVTTNDFEAELDALLR